MDEPPGRRGKPLHLMSPAMRPIYKRFFTGGLHARRGAGEQIRLDICAQRIPDPQL